MIFDLPGGELDPTTGRRKRKQRWVTISAKTKREADARLADLIGTVNGGTFVEPSKLTLVDYLRRWHATSVVPLCRPATIKVYRNIIELHVARSALAWMPLQKIRSSDLEAYLLGLRLAYGTVSIHQAVLRRALRKAVKDRLLTVNPALDLERPRRQADRTQGVRDHCWSPDEARRFLETAKTAGPQSYAFMALALDAGARKCELFGLRWSDVDFEASTVRIERQLDGAGAAPVFGPTKTRKGRTVTIGLETLAALRTHKVKQSELKMANRTTYQDFDLVFAKEVIDCVRPGDAVGQPLVTLSEARFRRLVKQAGVRRIRFHGLRHTCATLLLAAGVPVHDVASRLGHATVTTTLNTYAHSLPSGSARAAALLGSLLHG